MGVENTGLVDININRAIVGLYGGGWTKSLNGKTYSQYQPQYMHRNIIMMNLRQNNAAIPDPSSPSSKQSGATADSQAWPWRFGNNIDINVWENCAVINCRLNDSPTDNFEQPNYVLESGSIGGDGKKAEFNYLHHSGIDINRNKILTRGDGYYAAGPHGKHGLDGFKTGATPEDEPMLFRPGIEIRDNWVKTLTRVKIKAAGSGLVIDNNVCTDETGKDYYMTENGRKLQLNNSATYENRGIDVSGWGVTVTNNDIYVQRGKIATGNYLSVDGEAILIQECCGGTSINDYDLSYNVLNPASTGYIGFWKMRDLNNIKMNGNDMGGKFIIAQADVNGCDAAGDKTKSPCFKLNNVEIKDNFNVSSITAIGTAGGSACNNIVTGNKMSGKIKHSTHVTVTGNKSLDGTTDVTDFEELVTAGSTGDASGKLTSPSTHVLMSNTCESKTVDFKVAIDCGAVDSVIYYKNTTKGYEKIGTGNLDAGTYNYTLSLASSNAGETILEKITARIFSNAGQGKQWTDLIEVKKECGLSVGIEPIKDERGMTVYPVPADDVISIKGTKLGEEILIVDYIGNTLVSATALEGNTSINVAQLQSGSYILRVGQSLVETIIVQ